MLEIHNNVLSSELFEKLRTEYTSIPYKFGWDSNKAEPAGKLFHHAPYIEKNYEHRTDITHRLADHPLLLQAWDEACGKIFAKEAKMLRCYFNLQVYGIEGALHRDSWDWHVNDSTSVIYLTPDNWNDTWGGGTLVYPKPGVSISGCVPKANRAAVFPAHLMHRAEPLSKRCLTSRTVLVFKACNVPDPYDDFAAKFEWNLHKVSDVQLSEHMYGTEYLFTMIQNKKDAWAEHASLEEYKAARVAAKHYLAYGMNGVKLPLYPTRDELCALIGDLPEVYVHTLSRMTRDEALQSTWPYKQIIEASNILVPDEMVEA